MVPIMLSGVSDMIPDAVVQLAPARWSPVKMLRSGNKFRAFDTDITRKKMVHLVSQMVVQGGRKVGEKSE